MQANSLTIFIIRQNIRECHSDEAKKAPTEDRINVSKQITKTTKTSESLILRKRRQANLQKNQHEYSDVQQLKTLKETCYTTFNFENFQHNRNYDSYIIVHTNKKIRCVVNTCPRATLKHRIFGKTQKKTS